MNLLSTSNQNGAPSDAANAVRNKPKIFAAGRGFLWIHVTGAYNTKDTGQQFTANRASTS